jgi:hypothetical protein
MCVFDADTLRCPKCGYIAARLPTFRRCRTVRQIAEVSMAQKAAQRITVPPLKLGTAVAKVLAAAGVTPERVAKVFKVPDCGCKARQMRLDAFGQGVSSVVERTLNAAANAVMPNPVSDDEIDAMANAIAASPQTNPGLIEQAKKAVTGEI